MYAIPRKHVEKKCIFFSGIEENVDSFNLEENLAVVQIGDRAWVRQHLTNDYNRVRDAIGNIFFF
jgi:hypothetical protein